MLFLAFITLGLFMRFYRLFSIPGWPDPDESMHSLNAFHLERFGDLHFFYTCNQAPFLFTWLLAFWFKLVGPGPSSLWLLTALISALVVPLLFLTARTYFTKGVSWILTAFGALAWWGLVTGRNGNAPILLPWAECSSLWMLGKVLKEPRTRRRRAFAFALGLALSLGFYSYPPGWGPMALGIILLALPTLWKDKGALVLFLGTLTALLSPLVFFAFQNHYGSYINTIRWGSDSFNPMFQVLVSSSYLTGLFWGKMDGDYYGPYWGGLFDPLTASLFVMGVLFAIRARKDPFWKCVGLAFVLALLPGILSANLEFYRIFLTFPLVLGFAAWGCDGLASQLPSRKRPWFLGLVLIGMAAFNLYHFLGPYQDRWKTPGPSWERYRSAANARAFRIIEAMEKKWGPGCVLQNFPSDMFDQSLTLADYPLDRAVEEGGGPLKAPWIAVLANDHYGSFLQERFPGGRWFSLSKDLGAEDGGLGLGLFPRGSIPQNVLKAWMAANDAFGEVAYVFLNRPTGRDYSGPLGTLEHLHSLTEKDPFLESCFWEKSYYLHLQNSAFGDQRKRENFEAALEDLRQALSKGYPAAHLFNELGCLLWLAKDRAGAQKAFERSVQMAPDFGPALSNLKAVQTVGATLPKP